MVRIGSLFSGIGGLDLGVEWALRDAGVPAETVWQCDADADCRAVLAKHWPHATRFDDVQMLPPQIRAGRRRGIGPWRDDHEGIDLLIGGFPCQDLSTAGRRAGLNGARSGLFFDLLRVIRLVRPRVVYLENVTGLLTRAGRRVLAELAALRFDAAWAVVAASDVGAPHQRRRWFCVAWQPVPDALGVGVHRQHAPRACWAAPEPVWHGADRAVADAFSIGGREGGSAGRTAPEVSKPRRGGSTVGVGLADPDSQEQPQPQGEQLEGGRRTCDCGVALGNTHQQRQPLSWGATRCRSAAVCASDSERAGLPESRVGRVLDGLPAGLDQPGGWGDGRAGRAGLVWGLGRWPAGRGEPQHEWEPPRVVPPRTVDRRPSRIKQLGNAVVPEQARLAFLHLGVPALRMAGVIR